MSVRISWTLYTKEHPQHFNPAHWINEDPAIVRALQQRAGWEMKLRQAGYSSTDTAVNVGAKRAGWRDMSRLGAFTGNDTTDRHLSGQPQELFEWPLSMQRHARTSPAERDMSLRPTQVRFRKVFVSGIHTGRMKTRLNFSRKRPRGDGA
jgi:hypothetical protein